MIFVSKTKHRQKPQAAHCGRELNPDKAQGKAQSPQGQGHFFPLHSAALGMLKHQEQCKQNRSLPKPSWSTSCLASFAGRASILKVCARASQRNLRKGPAGSLLSLLLACRGFISYPAQYLPHPFSALFLVTSFCKWHLNLN